MGIQLEGLYRSMQNDEEKSLIQNDAKYGKLMKFIVKYLN